MPVVVIATGNVQKDSKLNVSRFLSGNNKERSEELRNYMCMGINQERLADSKCLRAF